MRVMVDMSATVLHHGHVRLLKRAKEIGTVIVGYSGDAEVLHKGYRPELPFAEAQGVLEPLRFVDEGSREIG